MARCIPALFLIIILTGCSTHPTIPVTRLEKGDVKAGYSFSLENVFPYYYYQFGVSDRTSLGLRIGLPIYGTGIDWNRVLFEKDNKWDLMSLSWSLNHNPNFDFTYYKISSRTAPNGKTVAYWIGFRGMYIPSGISENMSTRVGLVLGTTLSKKLSLELGYCHDFSAMPIGQIFNFKWDPDSDEFVSQYGDKDPVSPSGMPSEYSRLTGISLKFSLALEGKDKKAPATD